MFDPLYLIFYFILIHKESDTLWLSSRQGRGLGPWNRLEVREQMITCAGRLTNMGRLIWSTEGLTEEHSHNHSINRRAISTVRVEVPEQRTNCHNQVSSKPVISRRRGAVQRLGRQWSCNKRVEGVSDSRTSHNNHIRFPAKKKWSWER